MREIKFRAWHSGNKQMLHEGYNGEVFVTTGQMFGYGESVELMQFTGLKDANGTDIYEGDVIATRYGRAVVIFHSAMFHASCFTFSVSLCTVQTRQGSPESQSCRVMGNIYENPELVELPATQVTGS